MLQRIVVIGLSVVLACGIAEGSAITQIEAIQVSAMQSSFDSTSGANGIGQQTMWSTNGAYLLTDNPTYPSYQFAFGNVQFSTDLFDDASSGGDAAGCYAGGTWSVELFDSAYDTDPAVTMSGTVNWYREDECDTPNNVEGEGILDITSELSIAPTCILAGAVWAGTDEAGVTTTMADLTVDGVTGGELVDYSLDWTADSATLTIWADLSVIPEPTTISLLAAAGLLLRKRRRT